VAKRFVSGEYTKRKVGFLWRKQLKDFEKILKRLPDGVNSDEHVHLYPPFFEIAARIAKEKGIPYIRLGEQMVPMTGLVRGWFYGVVHRKNLATLKREGLTTSAALASLDKGLDERGLLHYPENTEVILHADIPDNLHFIKARLKGRAKQ
jgi:predicted glycoside hydrolase/deacetylase ChbG (UPF0249 family)